MNKKRKYDHDDDIEEEYSFCKKKQKMYNDEYEDKINVLFFKNKQLEYELNILKENYEKLNTQIESLKNKIYYYNNIPDYIS
jgi:predicted  nucleic acid-binding Zn-ribbon protein